MLKQQIPSERKNLTISTVSQPREVSAWIWNKSGGGAELHVDRMGMGLWTYGSGTVDRMGMGLWTVWEWGCGLYRSGAVDRSKVFSLYSQFRDGREMTEITRALAVKIDLN
jgi:hypothetical protein